MNCDICGSSIDSSIDDHGCRCCGARIGNFLFPQDPYGNIATILLMPDTRARAAEIKAKRARSKETAIERLSALRKQHLSAAKRAYTEEGAARQRAIAYGIHEAIDMIERETQE